MEEESHGWNMTHGNYKYVTYRRWRYCWSTQKKGGQVDKPWVAFVLKPGDGNPRDVTLFAKRASAKRRSLRMKETHIKRNERQRQRSICPSCEARVKAKGDYICSKCRYG